MFILVSFHIKKEEEVICISVLFQLFVIDFKIGWVYSADFEINIMPVIKALFLINFSKVVADIKVR